MAAISDSSSALDGFNSPRPRRSLGSRNPPSSSSSSSAWSQIVRSIGNSGAIPATIPISQGEIEHRKGDCSSSSEAVINNCDGHGNAWNKLSNDTVVVGNVIDASSWPALARASPKSSSDSLKDLGEGSVVAVSTTLQGPVIPSSPQKSDANNTNHHSTPNHALSPRQQPVNREGVQSLPSTETTQSASDRAAVVGVDSSPRDFTQRNNNRETGSQGAFGWHQPHAGNDHRRNSFRRGNGSGPHPRGGGNGSYHNSYGSRRNQDHSNFEWNPYQNFSGKDIHMRHQRAGPRGFGRQAPPAPPPFISPLPVRAYAAPMGFPDLRSPLYYVTAPPPESLSGVVPYFAHPAPPGMFIPGPDPQLRTMLVKQIDYYFSSENLCKDVFLREKMDEQGWVPINLIATFNRIKQLTMHMQLTMHIPFLLEAVRSSTVVEVQGDKIRKRTDWMNWLLPPSNLSGISNGEEGERAN